MQAYLETQTELIVQSIQLLLSAIRTGTPTSRLDEILTEITTIVSSVVDTPKDSLLSSPSIANMTSESGRTPSEILRDLGDNCEKLSEMQQQLKKGGDGDTSPLGVMDKTTKQAMASASFGVAKALKELNGFLGKVVGGDMEGN